MGHFKEALVRANLGECAEAILTAVDSFQDIRNMDAGDMAEVEKKLTSYVKKRKFSDFVAAVQSGSRGMQSVRNDGRPRAPGASTSDRA